MLAAILIRALAVLTFSASATCPLDVRPERPFRPRRPIRRPIRKLINFLFLFSSAGCGGDERADGTGQHRRRLHRPPRRHDRLLPHRRRRVRLGKEDAPAG